MKSKYLWTCLPRETFPSNLNKLLVLAVLLFHHRVYRACHHWRVYGTHLFFCSIFPSPEQQLTASMKPAAHNTGGSLPDLTNIQFPPPLPTPLDHDDPAAASFGSQSSTQALGNTQGGNKHSLLCSLWTYLKVMCRI